VIAAAREWFVGLTGMSRCRSNGAADPPELVIGFGNLTENAIRDAAVAVAGLFRGGPGFTQPG
jgi:GntR family transcriptional regulator / MocR family aminotransferase